MGKVNRSQLLEECVLAMRSLWSEPKSSFHVDILHSTVSNHIPKPLQDPLPIHMAGKVDAVHRRIARHAQGWIEVTYDPEHMKTGVEKLRQYMEEEGRGGEKLEISRQFS